MEKSLNFKKDFAKKLTEMTKLEGADKIVQQYERGLITLNDAYLSLCSLKVDLAEKASITNKAEYKDLKVGDEVLQHVDDFDMVKPQDNLLIIKEICEGHIVAFDTSIDHDIWIFEDDDLRWPEKKEA